MSTTVRSYGFMALMVTPLTREQMYGPDDCSGLVEDLYDKKINLNLTYDGTIVYSDMLQHAPYSQREAFDVFYIGSETEAGSKTEFLQLCAQHGLDIHPNTIQPYVCIWYNGSDSPMSTLEKAEFEQRAGLAQ